MVYSQVLIRKVEKTMTYALIPLVEINLGRIFSTINHLRYQRTQSLEEIGWEKEKNHHHKQYDTNKVIHEEKYLSLYTGAICWLC